MDSETPKKRRLKFDKLPTRKRNWFHNLYKNSESLNIQKKKTSNQYLQFAANQIGTTKTKVIHTLDYMEKKIYKREK